MTDTPTFAPRPIQRPAVLQVGGQAPCFGTLASIAEQGLAFDFHACTPPANMVGSKAILDFNVHGQHYAFATLFVHVQGRRALLSLREAPPSVLTALAAATRENAPPLAASLAILQRQHACHVRFMEGMRAVVDAFYQRLPEEIELFGDQALSPAARAGLNALNASLASQRDRLVQQFCLAYPMYPEQRASYAGARQTEASMDLVDMEQVDDWIRRTTVAQRIDEALAPLPHEFNRHYNALLKNDYTEVAHPYRLESVLNVLADLIAALDVAADLRLLCYKAMGHAFEAHAAALYPALIQVLGVEPEDTRAPAAGTDLATWLKAAAAPRETGEADAAAAPSPAGAPPSAAQIGELNALLERLTLALGTQPGPTDAGSPPQIPALSAHDRILSRFLPQAAHAPAAAETAPAADTFGRMLGALGGLDATALDSLRAQLLQPPPIEAGPERLPATSQVRELLQQAQGLVLQYTLNGLTYEARPDHPAWALLNQLDALHLGADDRGRLLDPAHQRAVSLAMQWLLAQDQPDDALQQVNALLAGLVAEFQAGRQARRAAQLESLGADPDQTAAGWCIVRRGDDAIPHEILGAFDDRYVLLNRSATERADMPLDVFAADIDAGVIEETEAYDRPLLERSASAALTASLDAVHAYTWKDPPSGCLRRSALMDELERRLEHPVHEPPTFCALVEIPTMRPSLSSLPGDELSVLQTKSGELLLGMLEPGEHCGRLSDVAFMIVFVPQDPQRVSDRVARLKSELESLHPSWKMIGAVVPLVAPDETAPSPSSVLRRANQACAGIRQQAGLELGGLDAIVPAALPPDTLPLASLYLRCQKIQPCTGGAPAHYEILLGLDDSLTPLHSTQSFVVMAEQTGRIHELDAWVLGSVLDWMERNASMVAQLSGLSINLSGACLTQQEHIDAMAGLFSAHPELARKLILEVTETSAIDNLDAAARALRTLKKLGCRIALDDFGSGYSSYGYIRRLPLDYLKIDGTYIRNILTDKTDQALTASMVDVAHALGIKVIAEYVDSEATFTWLKDLGVDYVQGYWVHEPQPLDTLALH
ncbi:MAG: EAL domain-containing protein [Pseudomonadota bacterium]